MRFTDGNAFVSLERDGESWVVTLFVDGKIVNQTRHTTRSEALISFGEFVIGELAAWHSDPAYFEKRFAL